MSNPIPSALALTAINDLALITASPHRNNYAAVQTAVNALITALSGGAAGQRLNAVDGTNVVWATTGFISATAITNPTTSYTAPAGTTSLNIQCTGGGGAGGGAVVTAAAQTSVGGGGSAGGWALHLLKTNIGTHTVAVGAGGTGVAGAAGNNGGATTFADTTAAVVATGAAGVGGQATAALAGAGIAAPGQVGASNVGFVSFGAASGEYGWSASSIQIGGNGGTAGLQGNPGLGRSAQISGSGAGNPASTNGGSGGGGAANGASVAAAAGGNGAAGIIIVLAYG